MLQSLRKKRKNAKQIIYTIQVHLPTKVTPDIDFRDKSVVQFDDKKYFCRWLQTDIKKINRYKWLQINFDVKT